MPVALDSPLQHPSNAFLGPVPARFISVFCFVPSFFYPLLAPPAPPPHPRPAGSIWKHRAQALPQRRLQPNSGPSRRGRKSQAEPASGVGWGGVGFGLEVGRRVGGGGSRGVPKGVMSDVALWLTPGSLAGLPP